MIFTPEITQKLRILYFSRDYTTHDHRFLDALSQTDHEIFFLRLERQAVRYEDRPIPEGVIKIPWRGGCVPARLRHAPVYLAALRQVIRDVKPDLVQAGPLQRSAFLVALLGFRPLVSMSWGYDLLHDVHRNRWWEWATRFTLRRSSVLVGDCETIRNLAVDYGMDANRIVTFPWGVDIQQFAPGNKAENELRIRRGWINGEFVLISTRSWAPLYGVEDLARAFVRAIQQRPELRLLMLGDGPQSSLLKQIFMQSGVLDYVHFPGQVSQQQLLSHYQAADLYISTSHSDGTSISLLEALAGGLPVLLTDIPGNQEWITPGLHGWLFKDGSVGDLEKAIIHAVDQRKKLIPMGLAARDLAEQRADWSKNFPKLFEAYKIALGNASTN